MADEMVTMVMFSFEDLSNLE